jgi:hypothetical protein
MFDIAQEVADKYHPDLMLFTFNTTALGYRRHWRVVKEGRPGFYRMYFSLDRSEEIDPARSIVHVNPITKRVTAQWCAEMRSAKERGEAEHLRNDPLLRDIVAEYRDIMRERSVPRITLNMWNPRVSFVYNHLKFGDPFHGMKMFSENSFWTPLSHGSYQDDPGFIQAVAKVNASKIPFFVIHLPMLQEMNERDKYASGTSGLTDAQQESALKSIAELTGKDIIQLAEYYPRPLLSNPLQLVASKSDSHPSLLGVATMADALERMLIDRAIVAPATNRPGRDGRSGEQPTPH